MFGKIRTIAGVNLYVTYTDVGALVLMLLAPVALSLIIGLAFGEGDNAIDLDTAQLLIVNQDETLQVQDQNGNNRNINWGQQAFEQVLIDNIPPDLDELIDAERFDNPERARELVEEGEYDAVLIIPQTFTADVVTPERQGVVELYYNPANEVTATILLTITEQIIAQINTGQIAERLLVGGSDAFLIQKAIALGQTQAINLAASNVLSQLFQEGTPSIITLNTVDIEGEEQTFDSLQYFAPSMAILFMTFAMAAGMRSILEEYSNWVFQRLMITPTPRWAYMVGKMLGIFASGVVQMILLLLITSIVAILLGRRGTIWGSDYIGIGLMIVASVTAASGLGLLITSISKGVRQADNIANGVILILAMLGGTFIPVENNAILDFLSNLSLNKWGIDGFLKLSDNGTLNDVLPNIAVLIGMGILFFAIALLNFNRRADLGG